jgi:hypothetical protein
MVAKAGYVRRVRTTSKGCSALQKDAKEYRPEVGAVSNIAATPVQHVSMTFSFLCLIDSYFWMLRIDARYPLVRVSQSMRQIRLEVSVCALASSDIRGESVQGGISERIYVRVPVYLLFETARAESPTLDTSRVHQVQDSFRNIRRRKVRA